MPPVAQLASRLTPRGWLIAGGSVVVAILFIYLFVHMVSQPSYTTLVSGVEPSQTGKMTSTLSAQGISYELQNNGTAIGVPSNEASKARVALAGANLLGNTQPGFRQLFEHQSLGESNFQQQVTYQRALQGQLDETIDSVQGVSGAQVDARAAELPEPDLRRKPERVLGRGAAVGNQRARSGLGARDRAAGRLERARPAAEQGHDHRRLGPAAVAAGRRRRGRHGRRSPGSPAAL